jgi:predicted RNA-binding protein with RPS1 domain
LREANASLNEPLEIGDTVFALVVHPEGPQGHAVLSLRRARPVRRWQEMARMKESGEVIAAPVVEANRGGVVVDLGVRGFVPLSQLASLGALERPDSGEGGVPGAVRALVGKDLTLKVIEVDQKRNRLILSEKAATQELRRHSVALKYNALRDVLDGKRVVVVDDSIVRGSTSGPIVQLLKRHGAREVHLRVCSPPLKHQCFFGVDMARRDELIASRMDEDAIRALVGADSLGYLSVEGMVRATGATVGDLCTACFTGDYLVPVQLELTKDVLEAVRS